MFSAIYRFRYCGMIALMAIISLSAGCQNPATPLATTQSEGQVKVIKSPNDPRAYHFETLPNGLKLLVIQTQLPINPQQRSRYWEQAQKAPRSCSFLEHAIHRD